MKVRLGIAASHKQMMPKSEVEIEVKPFRSWHIANYNGLKATGSTRTEAIAHLLLSLRREVEIVEIRVRPAGTGNARRVRKRTKRA